jgi:hypothetical protein
MMTWLASGICSRTAWVILSMSCSIWSMSSPSTTWTQSLALLDSSDRESRPDTDTFSYIENERNIFLEQVNSGVTREGTAIFSVSPNASGFRLRVGDADILSSEEAYVDLGF